MIEISDTYWHFSFDVSSLGCCQRWQS